MSRVLSRAMLPPLVREAMTRLLADLDVDLRGRVEGLYVVGSAATGAFVPSSSDIDFVAVLGGSPPMAELDRLRRRCGVRFAGAVARWLVAPGRRWPMGVNGAFVRWEDLARSPLAVAPIAGQIAGRLTIGAAAEVNPVTWKLLAEHGVAVRGPHREHLDVAADPRELHAWTRENLRTYWTGWARNVTHDPLARLFPRQATTWGALGAPRLHYTLATGTIASKEQAGAYALETFGSAWHALVRDALAHRRGARTPRHSLREAAAFVEAVVASGESVMPPAR